MLDQELPSEKAQGERLAGLARSGKTGSQLDEYTDVDYDSYTDSYKQENRYEDGANDLG